MPRRRPKKLDQLLGSQRLQQFADFTEQHQRWQQLLRDCFEKQSLQQLLPQCEVLTLRASTLTLQVASAAIAQRLKTEQAGIITYFQTHATPAVTSLEIRIRPSRHLTPRESAPAPAKVDVKESDTVRKLREQAELCEEPLRSQLLALADKYSSP